MAIQMCTLCWGGGGASGSGGFGVVMVVVVVGPLPLSTPGLDWQAEDRHTGNKVHLSFKKIIHINFSSTILFRCYTKIPKFYALWCNV